MASVDKLDTLKEKDNSELPIYKRRILDSKDIDFIVQYYVQNLNKQHGAYSRRRKRRKKILFISSILAVILLFVVYEVSVRFADYFSIRKVGDGARYTQAEKTSEHASLLDTEIRLGAKKDKKTRNVTESAAVRHSNSGRGNSKADKAEVVATSAKPTGGTKVTAPDNTAQVSTLAFGKQEEPPLFRKVEPKTVSVKGIPVKDVSESSKKAAKKPEVAKAEKLVSVKGIPAKDASEGSKKAAKKPEVAKPKKLVSVKGISAKDASEGSKKLLAEKNRMPKKILGGSVPGLKAPKEGPKKKIEYKKANITIEDIVTCKGISKLRPVEPSDRFSTKRVYCWVKLKSDSVPYKLYITFYYQGKWIYRYTANVSRKDTVTWCYKTIWNAGEWTIKVTDAGENVLATKTFYHE